MPDVQWPASAVGGSDLKGPIVKLLEAVNPVQGSSEDDQEAFNVIKSEATNLGKWWAGIVAGAGGITGIGVTITGFLDKVGGTRTGDSRSTVILAGALIAVAGVLAVSVIVWADLRARGTATAARLKSDADIVVGFLSNVPPPPATFTHSYAVHRNDGSWSLIDDFKWLNGNLVVEVGGLTINATDIQGILRIDQVVTSATP